MQLVFEVLLLLLSSLVVWRIASIVISEEAPAGVAVNLRRYLGVEFIVAYETVEIYTTETVATTPDKQPIVYEEVQTVLKPYTKQLESHLQPTLLARGVTCMWCTSPWVAAVITALTASYYDVLGGPLLLMFPFVMSTIAIYVEGRINNVG